MLLRLISWPYVRKHLLRTLLTATGIVLGVSVFVGMHAANQSVLFAFHQTVEQIAGKTELQVTAGETGFGEDVLEQVQAIRSVRVAVPVIEAVVDTGIAGQGSLLVIAVDMTGDRSLRDYDLEGGEEEVIDDPLIFLAQPDSIILTRPFAQRNGLTTGDKIPLGTVEGVKPFTVRGLMRSSGLASAFGGNIAVMDIYAAQKMFGRGRTFDRIDLAVKPGARIADVTRELQGRLGPGFEVQAPAARGQQFENVLAGYSTMISVSSAFALFIGMFIIYNSFVVAVTQRRSEIGILRALGATRGQVQRLFLAESAVLGLAASAIGAGAGVLIARGVSSTIGQLVSDVYGISQRVDDVATNPLLLLLALVVGMATSLGAAAIPAREAARVDPVAALHKGSVNTISARSSRARSGIALALAIAAGAALWAADRRVFYVGYALVIASTLLLVPMLSRVVAVAFRPILRWVRPVEGSLAADSLILSPRRTAASVTALMLSLAMVIGFSGMAQASYSSIVDWMDVTLNPDLFVSPTQSFDLHAPRFPGEMAAELRQVPGVDRVQWFRNGRITFRGRPAMIVAIEMASVAQTAPREPVAGEAVSMYREAAAGRGVIVSDNLAQIQGLRLGDQIEVAAPYGSIHLPIVGIIVDYSDQQGSILVDRALFTRFWKDDSASDFRVYVTKAVSLADVRQRILQRYAGQRRVFVLTNSDIRSYILKTTDQWFGLTNVQVAVAVFVAILGIVNALTVSVADRRREFGVLQAVGGLRWQIRGTIWLEALTMAAIGLVIGCALGAINLYYVLDIVKSDVVGMRLDYVFPFKTVAVLVPVLLGAAFVAALWPAEAAVRGSLVEALEYE